MLFVEIVTELISDATSFAQDIEDNEHMLFITYFKAGIHDQGKLSARQAGIDANVDSKKKKSMLCALLRASLICGQDAVAKSSIL